MIPTSDSLEAWINYAERCLHGLAHDLRRVPFVESTRRMHLRALELKRAIARWGDDHPDLSTRAAVLDEVEALAKAARDWRGPHARGRRADAGRRPAPSPVPLAAEAADG